MVFDYTRTSGVTPLVSYQIAEYIRSPLVQQCEHKTCHYLTSGNGMHGIK